MRQKQIRIVSLAGVTDKTCTVKRAKGVLTTNIGGELNKVFPHFVYELHLSTTSLYELHLFLPLSIGSAEGEMVTSGWSRVFPKSIS